MQFFNSLVNSTLPKKILWSCRFKRIQATAAARDTKKVKTTTVASYSYLIYHAFLLLTLFPKLSFDLPFVGSCDNDISGAI